MSMLGYQCLLVLHWAACGSPSLVRTALSSPLSWTFLPCIAPIPCSSSHTWSLSIESLGYKVLVVTMKLQGEMQRWTLKNFWSGKHEKKKHYFQVEYTVEVVQVESMTPGVQMGFKRHPPTLLGSHRSLSQHAHWRHFKKHATYD